MGEHCPLIFNTAEFKHILKRIVCMFCLLLCFEDMTRVTHLHLWACHGFCSLVTYSLPPPFDCSHYRVPLVSLWLLPPSDFTLISSPALPCFRWESPYPSSPWHQPPPAKLFPDLCQSAKNARMEPNISTFTFLNPDWADNVWVVCWCLLATVQAGQWWQRDWLQQGR